MATDKGIELPIDTPDNVQLFLRILSETFILEDMIVLENLRKEIFTQLLTDATVKYNVEVAVGFELRGLEALGDSRDPIETLAFVPVLAKGPGDSDEYENIITELQNKKLDYGDHLWNSSPDHDKKLNGLRRGHIIRLSQESIFRKVFEIGHWEGNRFKRVSYTGERIEPFAPYTAVDRDCISRYNGNPEVHNISVLTVEGEPYRTTNEGGEEVAIEQVIGELMLGNFYSGNEVYVDPSLTREFRRTQGIRLAKVREKQRAMERTKALASTFANTIEGYIIRAQSALNGTANTKLTGYDALVAEIGNLPEGYRKNVSELLEINREKMSDRVSTAQDSLEQMSRIIEGLKNYVQ